MSRAPILDVGLKESQLRVIPNIVLSSSELLKRRNECDFDYHAKLSDRPVIACVGRLTAQKGFDYAIRIFRIVQNKIPMARLIIVGDGPEKEALMDLTRSLALFDNVSFVSRMDDLTSIYVTSTILLFPSRYEGFPNVLAEAMAHGLPAVAFDCLTGPADLIEHGVNGYLAKVGDIVGAADLALMLLRDHELRMAFASRAMIVAEKFSPDVIGEMWSNLVEWVGS